MKKIAIIQSSYIPWKGYFDIINSVDEFVFYDCVQYTKRDWRTRNYLKSPKERQLLTIPVHASTSLPINQIKIDNSQKWQTKHFKAFEHSYCKSKFWQEYVGFLEEIYLNEIWENLSDFNHYVIIKIANLLSIKTKFVSEK